MVAQHGDPDVPALQVARDPRRPATLMPVDPPSRSPSSVASAKMAHSASSSVT